MSSGNMRLLWLSVACVLCHVSSPEHSPIYVDNERGQTVAGEDISELERDEIQEDLLRLLGLHRRPRPAFQEMESSAPQFLMDIYNNMVDDEDTGETGHTAQAQQIAWESDLGIQAMILC